MSSSLASFYRAFIKAKSRSSIFILQKQKNIVLNKSEKRFLRLSFTLSRRS
jgi:hypothetical protein